MKKLISIVVPACNEAGNIKTLYQELRRVETKKYTYEYLFVDDGSTDETLKEIKQLAKSSKQVKYLAFTRNFGHQYALKAGLDHTEGEAVVTMDADLQHPPRLIPLMLKEWEQGKQIVYTKRAKSEGQAGKGVTSSMFYRLINSLSETKIEPGAADYRLLDREVVEIIRESKESTLFLRGLVAWTGYPSSALVYKPNKRHWGKTKYSVSRMVTFAIDAITSFSIVPLRMATIIGFVMSLFSGVYGVYAVLAFLTHKESVIVGWPSVIISVLFIGGIQLMILGIMGEYLGKIFVEAKKRPLYIVKESKL